MSSPILVLYVLFSSINSTIEKETRGEDLIFHTNNVFKLINKINNVPDICMYVCTSLQIDNTEFFE